MANPPQDRAGRNWPLHRPLSPSMVLACCALAGAAAHLALWQVSEPPTLFSDFYKAYYPAAEALLEAGLKATFPFTEVGAGGFVNVPVLAWLFVPLVPLGEDAAGWVFLAIGAAATVLAYVALKQMARPDCDAAVPLLLAFLLNGPLINSLREGNTTHFVLLALVLALALMQRGSDFAAGLLIGFCAVLKLPLLLYGAYFLVRRRWHAVAGVTAAVGGTLLLSVAAFGLANNLNWLSCCVQPFLGGIIPAFNVQSLDGFAVRLITGVAQLADWEPMRPPLAYRLVRLVIFAALIGTAMLVARRAERSDARANRPNGFGERDLLEYLLVVSLALVISPISWSHYYLLLLLPAGLYLGGRLSLSSDRVARRLMWAAIVLSSLPVVVLPLRADLIGETIARTLVSAWFFGGVAMLLALLRGLYLQGGRSPRIAGEVAP